MHRRGLYDPIEKRACIEIWRINGEAPVNRQKVLLPFFTGAFTYANNEPKSALARDLGDCRDVLAHSH